MLTAPGIPTEILVKCLDNAFGLFCSRIDFLPLGADLNTAVYRVETQNGDQYFCKLRSGKFAETACVLPKILSDQGIDTIITPLPTLSGQVFTRSGKYCVSLYPFIEGLDGYHSTLTQDQWLRFGCTVRKIHDAQIPPQIIKNLPVDLFSQQYANRLLKFLQGSTHISDTDPIVIDMLNFLQSKRNLLLALITSTKDFSRSMAAQTLDFVVCHGDLHPGNLLIEPSDRFFVVDWDTLIRAPREKDLMCIGGGLGFLGASRQEETEWFLRGYGQVEINEKALRYYRYARILEDLAVEVRVILSIHEKGDDRSRALEFLKQNFQREGTLEIASQGDTRFGE